MYKERNWKLIYECLKIKITLKFVEDYLFQLHLLGSGGQLFIIVIKDDTTTVLHIGRH